MIGEGAIYRSGNAGDRLFVSTATGAMERKLTIELQTQINSNM